MPALFVGLPRSAKRVGDGKTGITRFRPLTQDVHALARGSQSFERNTVQRFHHKHKIRRSHERRRGPSGAVRRKVHPGAGCHVTRTFAGRLPFPGRGPGGKNFDPRGIATQFADERCGRERAAARVPRAHKEDAEGGLDGCHGIRIGARFRVRQPPPFSAPVRSSKSPSRPVTSSAPRRRSFGLGLVTSTRVEGMPPRRGPPSSTRSSWLPK